MVNFNISVEQPRLKQFIFDFIEEKTRSVFQFIRISKKDNFDQAIQGD